MSDFDLTQQIIGEAIYVHKSLGPGLLESTYKNCLYYRLKTKGLKVEKKILPVVFDGQFLECGYRLDLAVEDQVIIELKSVKMLKDIHKAQMITYLKLSGYRIGLLLNFYVLKLVNVLFRLKY